MERIASTSQQQGSRLLALPAELRDYIYEMVSETVTEVDINAADGVGISDLQHPLSQTCRQLRREFSPYFLEAAKGQATALTLPAKNFILPSEEDVRVFLRSLPPLTGRIYIQNVLIDNNFDVKFSNRAKQILAGSNEATTYLTVIRFCGDDFDDAALERFLIPYEDRDQTFKEFCVIEAMWDALFLREDDRRKARQNKEKKRTKRARGKKGKAGKV